MGNRIVKSGLEALIAHPKHNMVNHLRKLSNTSETRHPIYFAILGVYRID